MLRPCTRAACTFPVHGYDGPDELPSIREKARQLAVT